MIALAVMVFLAHLVPFMAYGLMRLTEDDPEEYFGPRPPRGPMPP